MTMPKKGFQKKEDFINSFIVFGLFFTSQDWSIVLKFYLAKIKKIIEIKRINITNLFLQKFFNQSTPDFSTELQNFTKI